MFFSWFKKLFVSEPSGVRAKDKRGRFVADDPNTPDVNEAYVDGKKPKSKAKAKAPAKKRGRGRPKGSKNKK